MRRPAAQFSGSCATAGDAGLIPAVSPAPDCARVRCGCRDGIARRRPARWHGSLHRPKRAPTSPVVSPRSGDLALAPLTRRRYPPAPPSRRSSGARAVRANSSRPARSRLRAAATAWAVVPIGEWRSGLFALAGNRCSRAADSSPARGAPARRSFCSLTAGYAADCECCSRCALARATLPGSACATLLFMRGCLLARALFMHRCLLRAAAVPDAAECCAAGPLLVSLLRVG